MRYRLLVHSFLPSQRQSVIVVGCLSRSQLRILSLALKEMWIVNVSLLNAARATEAKLCGWCVLAPFTGERLLYHFCFHSVTLFAFIRFSSSSSLYSNVQDERMLPGFQRMLPVLTCVCGCMLLHISKRRSRGALEPSLLPARLSALGFNMGPLYVGGCCSVSRCCCY